MQQITKQEELNKTPVSTPLTNCSVCDCVVTTNLENSNNLTDNSMFSLPLGSGNNRNNSASMSCQERVFVISYWNKPLTPCKKSKARKLLLGGVAKPVWNKFGMFGIKMFGAIKDLYRFLAACQLFIGKQPSSVPSPSIIFFPLKSFTK